LKYAIISDIHGNLEAFQAVVAKCEELKIDRYMCLGDVVGYGADPAACMDLLQTLPLDATVMGNHDEQAPGEDEIEGFSLAAHVAMEWTRKQLSDDQKTFLRELPFTKVMGDMTLVHATLKDPEKWGYVFDRKSAAANMAFQETPLCFCGHSHVPLYFEQIPPPPPDPVCWLDKVLDFLFGPEPVDESAKKSDTGPTVRSGIYTELTINSEHKYLINVGSVGQPRGGNWKAAFAVYDTEAHKVTIYRIPYEIAKAQEKIRAAELPEKLAARLEKGA
jgi:diadenosine tetraphosphatase ApaH/serine/threonine PP2A family protein phosphatase